MKKYYLYIIVILLSFSVFAEESDPEIAKSTAFFSIGAELGVGALFIMPEASIFVTAEITPVRVFSIIPKAGIAYLFLIQGPLDSNLFFPVGIDLVLNSYNTGLSLLYYLPLNHIQDEGVLTVSIKGFLPIISTPFHGFLFSFDFGAGIVWDKTEDPMLLIRLKPSLHYSYSL